MITLPRYGFYNTWEKEQTIKRLEQSIAAFNDDIDNVQWRLNILTTMPDMEETCQRLETFIAIYRQTIKNRQTLLQKAIDMPVL